MSVKTLLRFRNADSTRDLNDRYVDLILPGVFSGGLIQPVPNQLKVDLQPWKLVSKDGMVTQETSAVTRLNTPSGQTTVIAVKVVYVTNNNPVVNVVAIEESAFNLLPDNEYYVVFGHVTVPVSATQVLNSYINYEPRDIVDPVGRLTLRGILASSGSLPVSGNKVGDVFIIADGLGNVPILWGWNGNSWSEMTNVAQITSDLSNHRQNLFSDEKHLTNDEKDAVAGSSGFAVSSGNPLVDSADTRLPTQSENDALVGSNGTPSSSNLFITQEFPFALTDEKSLGAAPVNPYVTLLTAEGPFYVGRSGVGSANQYFKFYHSTEPREFVTAASSIVNVAGVYKNTALTLELDPSADVNVDSLGYYTGTLYIKYDVAPDAAFRVLYGRKFTFGTYPANAQLRRGVNDAQTSAQTVKAIEDIKGRTYSDTPPTKEQNINLRRDVVSVKEYLSAALVSDHVIADYSRVQNVPDFADDFVPNVGIDKSYLFENTSLVVHTYNGIGTVTYTSPVNLASVYLGSLFLDDSGIGYVVTGVGVNSVSIANRNGTIPSGINGTITTSDSGSIVKDSNPRNINLATLDVVHGRDRINCREIEFIPNEYHPVTENVAYQIRVPLKSSFYREPRVRFYGSFFNRNLGVQSRVVCNGTGRILITGLFTDLYLLLDLNSGSPTIDVYLDGNTTPTSIDLSKTGKIADYGTTVDVQQKAVLIADTLPLEPHTVEIVIPDSAGDFVIYGLDLVNRNIGFASVLPGRSFVQSDLYKSDAIISYNYTAVIPQGRGAVQTWYVNRNLVQQVASYAMTDFDGTVNSPGGTAVSGTPNFTVTSGITKFGTYFKANDIVHLITATATEVKVIQSVVFPVVTFTDNVNTNGAAILLHVGSTEGESADPTREYARYYSDQMGIEQSDDFSIGETYVTDRTYTLEDGTTSIAGKELDYTATGIDGISRAIELTNVTSTLRIRALCSRMDILVANGGPVTLNYQVDGSPVIARNLTGGGLTRVPVILNARYQTHEVYFSNSQGMTFAGVILHEPTLSTKPEGSLLATQNLLARYAVGTSSSGDLLPIGGVAIDPYISSGIYVNGSGSGSAWTYSKDFTNAPAFGRYLSASQEGSYFEYEFFGNSFELEYQAGPDRGIVLVYLNGLVANSINYPSAGFFSITPATGKVDMYAASVTRKRFGLYSLPTTPGGTKYIVRVEVQTPREKNILSSGYNMNITSIYKLSTDGLLAVTPSRSREGYLYGEDQCRDERNFDSGVISTETLPVIRAVVGPMKSNTVALVSGAISVTVVFPDGTMPSPVYSITANFLNTVDGSPLFQPIIITGQTQTGFTAKWNVPLDSNNYSLVYVALAHTN